MHTIRTRTPRPCRRSGLAATASALLLLLGCATAFAEPAGRVLFVAGNVMATDRGGSVRALERGGGVEEGDTIATGDGRIQVEFKDGGYFALAPNTRFRVDRYAHVAAGDAEDSVVVALLKGGLRTISGLVGKKNRSDYRVDTGVATIGIRGTDYALDLNSALTGNVAEGAIEVCNGAGCQLVQAGQAFFVPSANEAPVLGERRAFLPPTSPEESPEAASSDGNPGKPQTNQSVLTDGRGKSSEAPALGSPNAAFDRLPQPAVGTSGMPSQSGAPGGNATQGTTTAPGLAKKGNGEISDPSGPPGLTKKDR